MPRGDQAGRDPARRATADDDYLAYRLLHAFWSPSPLKVDQAVAPYNRESCFC